MKTDPLIGNGFLNRTRSLLLETVSLIENRLFKWKQTL